MTRFHRVRLFLLPAAAVGALLTSPSPTALLLAQSDAPPPAPANWTIDDDQSPDAVDWSDDVPAHVAVVDGSAWLGRDNGEDVAVENVPLLAGDRLRTARGRVEVLFDDGSALALDENTTVDLLSDSLIRLQSGRLRLSLARGTDSSDYRVDAAGTTVMLRPGGEYRVSLQGLSRTDPEVLVAVTRGSAEIGSPFGRTLIRPGYEAAASGRSAPSAPYVASSASSDGFDLWAENLRDDRASAASARYLPTEVRSYGGLFDRYGDWQYDSSYGYVWYPRVDTGWRPYYQGEWSYVGSYGWFWIGSDRWSWPTHHYGRWGVTGTRWYWIPDRRWGPAWVSWASAPGYLSWCPLGYNNRPLISINIGYSSSPWRAWTAVPLSRFSNRIIVNSRSRAYSVPSSARFVERRSAPFRPVLARGNAEPLRSPGFRGSGNSGTSAVTRAAVRNPMNGDNGRVMSAGDNRRSGIDDRAPSRAGQPARDDVRSAGTPAGTVYSRSAGRTDPRAGAPVSPTSAPPPTTGSGVVDRSAHGRQPQGTIITPGPQPDNTAGRGFRRAPAAPATGGAPQASPWNRGRTSTEVPQAPRSDPGPDAPRAYGRAPGGGMPSRPAPVDAPRARPEPQPQPQARQESPRTGSPRSAPSRNEPRTEAPRQQTERSSGRSAPAESSGGDRARSRR
ncbi:MAG: DUF6600 domain-containing protein [Acidobacteriota bacterium]